MTKFVQRSIATVLWIFLISMNASYYILGNNENIRIISLSSDCREGRIEFYNGSIWGTLSDCSTSFKTEHVRSICKTLGWEFDEEYWRGSNVYDQNISLNPLIAYTSFTNCTSLSTYDTCSDCIFTKNLSSCNMNNNEIHNEYDIFIRCNNYGNNRKSTLFPCMTYDHYNASKSNIEYKSCSYSHSITNNKGFKTLIIIVVAIAIFGSIFCVILFALHSKYQDTKRNKTNLNHTKKTYTRSMSPINSIKNRNSGFSTVPQELQLGPINNRTTSNDNNDDDNNNNNNTNYIPPPQPMFIYQTREVEIDENDEMNSMNSMNRLNHINDMNDDNDIGGGYDMEEIIPSVIYSNNKSASESYGLIKNQDDEDEDDEDDEDEDDQQDDDDQNET